MNFLSPDMHVCSIVIAQLAAIAAVPLQYVLVVDRWWLPAV